MEINRGYYAVYPASVRYDKDLSTIAKLLYGEITALVDDKGVCSVPNSYFADLYDCSERTVIRSLKLLEYKGYIHTEYVTLKIDEDRNKTIREIHIDLNTI